MSIEKPISKSTLFVDGAARFKDLIYIVARDRGLQEEAVEHSRFIAFYQQNFCHNGDRNWSGIAVCVVKKPTEKMVSVGEDGEVLTYVGGTVTEEQIVPEPMALRNHSVACWPPEAAFSDVCALSSARYRPQQRQRGAAE